MPEPSSVPGSRLSVTFAQNLDPEYDYIVVGSGAGGGPVAANLARAGHRVLVLEAGGADEPPDYEMPAFHALSTEHADLAWKFYVRHYTDQTQQERDTHNYIKGDDLDGEVRHDIFYPRAGTLGGCTAHHAMIFIAPHNDDWDEIAKLTGDDTWSASRMRTLFQRMEHCDYAKRWWDWLNLARHGYKGWLHTKTADPLLLERDHKLARLVLSAFEQSHHDHIGDLSTFVERLWARLESKFDPNDWRRLKEGFEGVTFTPLTIDNGRRNGTRECIIATMRDCPDKLTVKLNALVTRVVLNGDRATGVEFLDGAHLYRADPKALRSGNVSPMRRSVKARREVILAGGTFNTPQLLMLSGIGPAADLAKHGIKPEVDLPDVGKHLQDRYEVGVVHDVREPFDILKNATFEAPKPGEAGDPEYQEWRDRRSGLYATNGATIAVIRRSSPGERNPDLYMFAVPGHFSGYRPGYSDLVRTRKDQFTWVILKGHTTNSAGYVRLRSDDPRDPPEINFEYFDQNNPGSKSDLNGVVAGVEYIRGITARTPDLITETIPGPGVRTRDEIAQFVRDHAWGHHACGTCRIGREGASVLDSRFRVRGVKGLRVVDASVFPSIPGLFILSAVYMVAEKASDAILEDARAA